MSDFIGTRHHGSVQVLIISGTVGAGKTAVARALLDELVSRGLRAAMVDVDELTRLAPAPDDDPFNDRIARAHLRAMVPNFLAAGVAVLLLPRVLETRTQRDHYTAALVPAQVHVARLTAAPATRAARLTARETDPADRAWHLARTGELEDVLAAAGVEDVVVPNEDTHALSRAAARLADWLGTRPAAGGERPA